MLFRSPANAVPDNVVLANAVNTNAAPANAVPDNVVLANAVPGSKRPKLTDSAHVATCDGGARCQMCTDVRPNEHQANLT